MTIFIITLFLLTAQEHRDWGVDNPDSLRFNFTNRGTDLTTSDNSINITIIDDLIAERRESLLCSLLAGVVDSVRARDPRQVTIVIQDNEGMKYGWHGKCRASARL